MRFVKLAYDDGHYRFRGDSDLQMCILGRFLSSDVGCLRSMFKEWALNPEWEIASGNITSLRKENGHVFLSDLYSEEETPTELQISIQQFVQLFDDWQEKACKKCPKNVLIKHENGQFIMETSD